MAKRLSPFVVAIVGVLVVSARAEAVGVGIADQTDPQPVQFRIEGGPLRDLATRFKPDELAVLEKLNRADVKHLSRLEAMVIPSEWRSGTDYSPFPQQYVAAAALPKVLIVDRWRAMRCGSISGANHGRWMRTVNWRRRGHRW